MDWWLISFFLGALLSLFLPTVPSVISVVSLILFTFLLSIWQKTRKYTPFLLGTAWMLYSGLSYQTMVKSPSGLLQKIAKEKIQVQGYVSGIAQLKGNTQRFNFIIDEVNGERLTTRLKLRLAWQRQTDQQLALHSVKDQQRWQLGVRIKPAHGLANLGSFSYQTWLRRHQIHATGYVVASGDNQLLADRQSLRQRLFDSAQPLLLEHPLSSIVTALSFGERSQLTKEQWRLLTATATQHLIAISGLHLGLVATGSYLFFNILVALLPISLCTRGASANYLRLNNKKLVILLSAGITIFYAYLAGFSLPTVRALVMLLLFWLAKLTGVKLSLTRWLALTLVIIILLIPESLYSSSFWLSFYAVCVIFLFIWRFNRRREALEYQTASYWLKAKFWFVSLFQLQLFLITAMLPLTILINHQVSLLALPANLVAVPWMSITSIPLSLLAILLLPLSTTISAFLMKLALLSVDIIWQWFTWLTQFSSLVIQLHQWQYIQLSLLVFWLIASSFIANRKKVHLSFISIFLLLWLVHYRQEMLNKQQWQVYVTDVGQGLAVVIAANNQLMLYDTGASYPSGFVLAETVLLPFFQRLGKQTLDLLVVSHDDNDHSGGLKFLQQHLIINQLISNEHVDVQHCLQGKRFAWQFLTIEMLWPEHIRGQHNDDSCVLKISDGNHSILLTGDISKKVEQQLIVQNLVQLKSSVLLAPHHGSKSSSSIRFLQAVAPDIAIFSAGFLNRWQMPVAEVSARYRTLNIKQLNTAVDGMITLDISAKGIKLQSYRENLWPFWFAN